MLRNIIKLPYVFSPHPRLLAGVSGLDSECAEIVADLERRIAETEAVLSRYETERERLQSQQTQQQTTAADDVTACESSETPSGGVSSVSGGEAGLEEQLAFTEANITGLTEELNSLKG